MTITTDFKRNKALQQATTLIHELSKAGYLADHCLKDATYHLAELFYEKGIEISIKGHSHDRT